MVHNYIFTHLLKIKQPLRPKVHTAMCICCLFSQKNLEQQYLANHPGCHSGLAQPKHKRTQHNTLSLSTSCTITPSVQCNTHVFPRGSGYKIRQKHACWYIHNKYSFIGKYCVTVTVDNRSTYIHTYIRTYVVHSSG